jgi:hypothetical protein
LRCLGNADVFLFEAFHPLSRFQTDGGEQFQLAGHRGVADKGIFFCTLSMAFSSFAMISMEICRKRTAEPSSKFTTNGGSMA